MRPNKARFVTVCQQLLALGAVFAVLAPAANVISLDVIAALPREASPQVGQPELPSSVRGAISGVPTDRGAEPSDAQPATVETEPVEPVVEEYPMVPASEADAGAGAAPEDRSAPPRRGSEGSPAKRTMVSAPEKVDGYGAVGVTWSSEERLDDDQISVEVRTRKAGVWSQWTTVEYHEEHGPDPESAEGQQARPGTDALLVGAVDEVQARATTAEGVASPADLRLAVVAPGDSRATETEAPAIDTAKLRQDEGEGQGEGAVLPSDEGDLALQATTTVTEKPQIFSRAQWGANEKMRDGSPSYYEVHAGFVHHTVNANNYSKDDVPAIIRSIYAYHTRSRGWSDIGYNFLVDRFGRIWEGRYGGVDLPVVGAHTLNYNNYAFAMSAIGNFDITKPPGVMVKAYGKLMAWKLSLHGVDASSTKQQVGARSFQAINGHRDAAATACPGRYLYAKIPKIRKLAAKHQSDWSGRDLATNIVGSPEPDLLLRKRNGKVFAVPTGGMLRWSAPLSQNSISGSYKSVVASPDLTGDGRADLVALAADGTSWVLPGTGSGFAAPIKKRTRFVGLDQVTAVGDLNGDKRNDLVARNPKTGTLYLFRGNGKGGIKKGKPLASWSSYDATAATGDVTGDGLPDLFARDRAGKLWLHPGTGTIALGARRAVAGSWDGADQISGFGDLDGDGKADLLVRTRSTQQGWVLPGNGKGGFKHAVGPITGLSGLASVTAGAVGGTSRPDLVGVSGGKVRVLPHAGTRNIGSRVKLGSDFANSDVLLNVGDWDRDGFGDVITRDTSGNLRLHRGLGQNRFAAPLRVATGFGSVGLLAAVGDVTGDGYPDLMGQPKGGAMRVYPGSGKGFRASFIARGSLAGTAQYGLGRWDADGAPDVLIRNGTQLTWYHGNGPGGLTGAPSKISTSLSGYDLVMSPGDVTRDGRQDLVVRSAGDGYLWVLPGTAKGFGAPIFLAQGFKKYDRAG